MFNLHFRHRGRLPIGGRLENSARLLYPRPSQITVDRQPSLRLGSPSHVVRQRLPNTVPFGVANQLSCPARLHKGMCHQAKCPTLHNRIAAPTARAAARREAE
jgi:hypothetical protein